MSRPTSRGEEGPSLSQVRGDCWGQSDTNTTTNYTFMEVSHQIGNSGRRTAGTYQGPVPWQRPTAGGHTNLFFFPGLDGRGARRCHWAPSSSRRPLITTERKHGTIGRYARSNLRWRGQTSTNRVVRGLSSGGSWFPKPIGAGILGLGQPHRNTLIPSRRKKNVLRNQNWSAPWGGSPCVRYRRRGAKQLEVG